MMMDPSEHCTTLNSFGQAELEHLVKAGNHRCVSLYLPTATAGAETLENPRRFKKLLKQAGVQLEQSGLRPTAAEAIVQPGTQLVSEYPFWQLQHQGLALFLSSGFFAGYRLPYPVAERAMVSTGFHLKPLLPLLADDMKFFILAVSRNVTRLYQATRFTIAQVPLPGVVTSEAEALRYDDPEQSLQVHTGPPRSGTGQQSGIVHGQGGRRDSTKERTLRFFQRMCAGLQKVLADENAPLLLAAVDYYLPLFRQANRYPHSVDEVLAGNPDGTSPEALRAAGWSRLEPLLRQEQTRSRKQIEQGLSTDRATDDVGEAVVAACQGRAGCCFVALDQEWWGEFDRQTSKVKRLDGREYRARDLLDVAAVQTVLQGGRVYPEESSETVPGSGPLAVSLRY